MAIDWNGALAYTTVKCVKIRNWKLGLMHYFFQFAIFCYVVIYAVLFERGFMFKEQIVGGSLTLNSQAPRSSAQWYSNPQLGNGTNATYCCDDLDSCPNSTSTLPCAFWDEYQTEYPPSASKDIAITTRVTVTRQTAPATCEYTSWGPECVFTDDGDKVAQFVARAEDYTIRIRHGVRGQQVAKQGVNTGPNALSGKLASPSDPTQALMSWPNDNSPYPGQGNGDRIGDIIPLSEILAAVGLDLDAVYPDDKGENSTARYDGISIVVSVNYEMQGISGSTLAYTYIPRLLDNLEFKIEEPQLIGGAANEREILNRHAVRLIFIQTGELGTFDLTALLITLVTALGLLAVANTLTNLVMTKLLDQKDLYNWHTTEVTEDVDKVLQLPPEELGRKMKVVKQQLSHGKGSFFQLEADDEPASTNEKTSLLGNGRSAEEGSMYSSIHGASAS